MGSHITSATEDSGVIRLEFDSGVTIIQILRPEVEGGNRQERGYLDCCRVQSWDTLSLLELTASSHERYPIPDAYSAVRNLDTGEVNT